MRHYFSFQRANSLLFFFPTLTLLLGTSLEFGSAVIFGFLFCVILSSTGVTFRALKRSSFQQWRFFSTLMVSIFLTTLFDVVLSSFLPETRKTLGNYFILLSINPLIFSWLPESLSSKNEAESSLEDVLIGFKFWALVSIFGFLRELIGKGAVTFATNHVFFQLPWFDHGLLRISSLPSGGFFLAAATLALVRFLTTKARHKKAFIPLAQPVLQDLKDTRLRQEAKQDVEKAKEPDSFFPSSDSTQASGSSTFSRLPWIPFIESMFQSFVLPQNSIKRFLVIQAGQGQLVYYLAMLGLEVCRNNSTFHFRVRGTESSASKLLRAVKGIYPEHQLNFIPHELRERYLSSAQENNRFAMADELRKHIELDSADVYTKRLFFSEPCDLIILNQSFDYLNSYKKAEFLRTLLQNIVSGGLLVMKKNIDRQFIPESFQQLSENVLRKN